MNMDILMKIFSLLFILITNFTFAYSENTYLICKKEEQDSKKQVQQFDNRQIKENVHKNFLFYNLNQSRFTETIIKIDKRKEDYKIFIEETRAGNYIFNEEKLLFIDELKFRVKKIKKELNRDTLDLVSKYKGETISLHKCEISNYENTNKKFSSLTRELNEVFKEKYKNFKM